MNNDIFNIAMIICIPIFAESFATDHMLGLVAIAQTVWSAMKIFICKYAPWDRGRTVLSCLWRDTGRNGKDAVGVDGNIKY